MKRKNRIWNKKMFYGNIFSTVVLSAPILYLILGLVNGEEEFMQTEWILSILSLACIVMLWFFYILGHKFDKDEIKDLK